MTVTQHLRIIFARRELRNVLLAFTLGFGVIGGVGLAVQLFDDWLTLSFWLDAAQFVLIQIALILIYISSSKKEGARFCLDTNFYLNRYKKEQPQWLWLKRTGKDDDAKLEARQGFGPEDIVKCCCEKADENCKCGEKNKEEGNAQNDEPKGVTIHYKYDANNTILSQSVMCWCPESPLKLDQIRFHLEDEWYSLPWFISEGALEQTLLRFNANSTKKFDYNGSTLSLKSIETPADDPKHQITFNFRKSTYFSYLATNMLPEVKLPGGVSYREMLEPGPKLHAFENASVENHIGLSCMFLTTDDYFIIPVRNHNVTVFKGQLSPSVSGAGNLSTCSNPDHSSFSPMAWLIHETAEELPFLQRKTPNVETLPIPYRELEHAFEDARFLGLSRELRRCGKPELFFSYALKMDSTQVRKLIKGPLQDKDKDKDKDKNNDQETEGKSKHSQDLNENEGYLLIPLADIHKALRMEDNKKKQITSIVLTHDGKKYELSESLLVNLIFYFRHHPA